MKRYLKIAISTLAFGYITAGLLLYIFQYEILYHPTADIKTKYGGLVLESDDAKVYVHVLNPGHENAILYFGGNGESMAKSSDYISEQFPKFTCYLMDYRGYGASTGKPNEVAIVGDALKLYDTIKSKHQRISIGGRSLGSGVATYVAAHREVSKLALITPYDSIVSIAQERYPIYPASLILKDSYNSIEYVKDIRAKTFIVMAENDTVVSKNHTLKLIQAFKKEKLMIKVIENRGHNDISDDDNYYKIMQDFIGEG